MIQYLNTVSHDPFMYEDTYFRMPDERQDMVWLAMLDNLIEKGYAFEIDWKENYSSVNSIIQNLLLKWGSSREHNDDAHLYGLDTDAFFPKINSILESLNYIIFNLDIDSDSYLIVMAPAEYQQQLLSLDPRIKKY
ncbi:DUF6630 family protein [Sphingobacterium sp. BIGb0165]|uniref:DUF6630 family protein n=1 Tax=Sphingobacterium sp. BIGb0165 TaxID=2940615 RepID=UPI002166F39C|nr:DUF6630 family protein [Sphingobacterium sp. BIGb0165]MCS4229265.1 hypothetical protein [Sphingobacterium sp. BIGb0165]